MTIRTATPPSVISQPSATFDKTAFDVLLWNKGYDVMLEESRQCPCRTRESGAPLVTCQSCRGLGYVFINPITTKAIITNIRKSPKFMEWSEENVGTVLATFRDVDRVTEMDRVTFVNGTTKRSETLTARTVEDQQFVFLTYGLKEVVDIFYFTGAGTALARLSESEYTLPDDNIYVIELNKTFPEGFNNVVTVTYLCAPQYLVIDVPKDVRTSTVVDNNGVGSRIEMPVNAVLRKSHIVWGQDDYGATGVKTIDNSYK